MSRNCARPAGRARASRRANSRRYVQGALLPGKHGRDRDLGLSRGARPPRPRRAHVATRRGRRRASRQRGVTWRCSPPINCAASKSIASRGPRARACRTKWRRSRPRRATRASCCWRAAQALDFSLIAVQRPGALSGACRSADRPAADLLFWLRLRRGASSTSSPSICCRATACRRCGGRSTNCSASAAPGPSSSPR